MGMHTVQKHSPPSNNSGSESLWFCGKHLITKILDKTVKHSFKAFLFDITTVQSHFSVHDRVGFIWCPAVIFPLTFFKSRWQHLKTGIYSDWLECMLHLRTHTLKAIWDRVYTLYIPQAVSDSFTSALCSNLFASVNKSLPLVLT